MAHFQAGEDFSAATYDDTLTNYYGETYRIIGESDRGTAWIGINSRGSRRFIFKYDSKRIITATEA